MAKKTPRVSPLSTLGVVAFLVHVLLSPVPFIFHVIEVKPAAYFVALMLIYGGVFLRYRHIVNVACPHCGKPPAPDRWGQIYWGEIDCCPHCGYWLIDLGVKRQDA